ncbi:hypothetical protein SLE2022_380080 [Rubroshorea leprosula]
MDPIFLYGLILLSLFLSIFLFYSKKYLLTRQWGHPVKFLYDRMARYSSQVFKTSILFEPMAVLCGSAGNKFFFSNENKLVTSWWPDAVNKICPSSTQTSSKEELKMLRQMLPTFLKPEALQMYIGTMDAIAQRNFEANWDGEQQVTVFPLAKRYTFWVACKGFLSIEEPDHVAKLASPFNALASAILSIPIDLPGTPFRRGIKASGLIRKDLMAIIK